MGGSGAGKVDEKKLRKIAEKWGTLPPEKRAKIVEDITRDLPAKYKPMIEELLQVAEQGPRLQVIRHRADVTELRAVAVLNAATARSLTDGRSLCHLAPAASVGPHRETPAMTIHPPRARSVLSPGALAAVDRVRRRPHDQRRQEDHRQARRGRRPGRDVHHRRRAGARSPARTSSSSISGNKVAPIPKDKETKYRPRSN